MAAGRFSSAAGRQSAEGESVQEGAAVEDAVKVEGNDHRNASLNQYLQV
jgi:hypothetical protein